LNYIRVTIQPGALQRLSSGNSYRVCVIGRIKSLGFAHVMPVNTPLLQDLHGEIELVLGQIVELTYLEIGV